MNMKRAVQKFDEMSLAALIAAAASIAFILMVGYAACKIIIDWWRIANDA